MVCVQNLPEPLTLTAGEYRYIPASVLHLPYDRSVTDHAVAVVARIDLNEKESVLLALALDELG